MIERVKAVLQKVGLTNLSEDPDSPLVDAGFDSLMLALSVLALEREFKLKIPPLEVTKENFSTLQGITKYIEQLMSRSRSRL